MRQKIIMLVVYMKCRFSLSYRELEELAMMIGIVLDHATCQRWIIKFNFERASYFTSDKVTSQLIMKSICINLLKAVNKVSLV